MTASFNPTVEEKNPGDHNTAPPVRPLQFGIPEPQLPTQIRFHLAHNTRNRIFRRYHQHHLDMVNLHTLLLYLHIGMILLDVR